jgi:hypothetical protein
MFEIAFSHSIVITLTYWTLDIDYFYSLTSTYSLFLDVSEHALNSVFMLVELILSRNLFMTAHWYNNVLIGVLYGITNLVYVKVSGQFVYSFLTWESGTSLT